MKPALISSACAAAAFLALASCIEAAEPDAATRLQDRSWYVSVFAGRSMAEELDAAFAGSITVLGTFDAEASIAMEDGFLAGAAVGVHANEWARAEVELSVNRHGADETVTFDIINVVGDVTAEMEGNIQALFVLANLWLDFPLGDGIRPYAGGGVGLGRLKADLDHAIGPLENAFTHDSDWGLACQLGAGVSVDVTPRMALDAGYRFKFIRAELELDPNGLLSPSTDTDADYRSHNIIAGVRWGF